MPLIAASCLIDLITQLLLKLAYQTDVCFLKYLLSVIKKSAAFMYL